MKQYEIHKKGDTSHIIGFSHTENGAICIAATNINVTINQLRKSIHNGDFFIYVRVIK